MNAHAEGCDHGRIDDFLNSDHVGLEDERLMAHLNSCGPCREYLETQAADPDSWSNAAELLRPKEFDQAGAVEYSVATIGYQQSDRPVAIQTVLDSLSPSDDPHRLGRLGGHEVSGVVGAGGMGVVLKAVDPSLDRVVAIKVMAPHLANNATARKRFSREAKAAAAVLHPNVIPIHCVSSDDKIPYLVMAYVRGGSLQKRLEQEGPLPTVEILRIGSQIAAGLAAAHEQGLVHRDIKPENILLDEGVERVTLTDFGLARAVDDASVTRDGTIAGTPQYMSPEQARGESVDQQSDLFSLGSVLYALCTGRPPFRAESSFGVMRRISDSVPTPIRELNADIPDWLVGIIEKLMAKEKTERFASASEVHKLLEACLGHMQQPTTVELPSQLTKTKPATTASGADSPTPPDQVQPRRQRSRIVGLTTVANLFLAAIVAAVVYYIQTNNGTVRVEVLDETLQVAIDGQVVTIKERNKQQIKLRPGPHKLAVSQGETEFLTDNFEIRRNDKLAFKVDLFPGEVVLSMEGRGHKSKTLRGAVPLHLNTELGSSNQTEKERKEIEKVSATALVNGCEVTGGFTAEQAEIAVKNPTREAKDVTFYYQIVYQDSRERGDIFVIAGGKFESELPPGRSELKRVDILPDPNRSAPLGHVKDTLAIRVSQARPGHKDIPIVPGKKLDIAKQPITIATQATPGYSVAARQLEFQNRFGPGIPARISAIKDNEKSDSKTTSEETAATQIKLLEQALDLYKLRNGAYPSTKEGLKALVEQPADENRAKNWSGYFLANEKLALDPWGNAFSYEFPGTRGGDRSKPNIWSLGPDGKPNTDDDVNNWDNKPTQEVDSDTEQAVRALIEAVVELDEVLNTVRDRSSAQTAAPHIKRLSETIQERLRILTGQQSMPFSLPEPNALQCLKIKRCLKVIDRNAARFDALKDPEVSKPVLAELGHIKDVVADNSTLRQSTIVAFYIRIKKGMTRTEVEKILGPSLVETRQPDHLEVAYIDQTERTSPLKGPPWGLGAILVDYDAGNKVIGKTLNPDSVEDTDYGKATKTPTREN